jgi:hypothetical protein
MSVTYETNQNLDGPQRELLLWNHKLSHMTFDWLQALPNEEILMLLRYSKVVFLPSDAKCVVDVNTMKLKEGINQAGDLLHIDQYKAAFPTQWEERSQL